MKKFFNDLYTRYRRECRLYLEPSELMSYIQR